MNRIALMFAVSTIAASAFGISSHASADTVVKIGAAGPLTEVPRKAGRTMSAASSWRLTS